LFVGSNAIPKKEYHAVGGGERTKKRKRENEGGKRSDRSKQTGNQPQPYLFTEKKSR